MIELNKIYNENCIETMKRMPDRFIDMVLTSPPYDSRRTYTGVHKFTFDEFKLVAKGLYRIVKDGGVVVWVVADETKNFCESLTSFKQAIYFVDDCGFNLLDTMIYYKKSYLHNTNGEKTLKYEHAFEYMFVFCKEKPKTFNPIKLLSLNGGKKTTVKVRNVNGSIRKSESIIKDMRTKGNVWEILPGGCEDNESIHPAVFPKQLVIDHIKSWSNEGDVVYDPMCGSGTVCKVCKLMNRKYIGSEIVSRYVELANMTLKRTDMRKKGRELWKNS